MYVSFSRNKQVMESIISDEILNELLKHAGISDDTSVRKDLTPEKAASKFLNLSELLICIEDPSRVIEKENNIIGHLEPFRSYLFFQYLVRDITWSPLKSVFLFFFFSEIKEAQRCLSNIYLQCHRALDLALNNDTLSGVMQQTTMYREYKIPADIISFDIKILFLITAQRTESR